MYIGQHGYLHWVFFFFLFPLSPSLPLLIPQDRSIDPKKGGASEPALMRLESSLVRASFVF